MCIGFQNNVIKSENKERPELVDRGVICNLTVPTYVTFKISFYSLVGKSLNSLKIFQNKMEPESKESLVNTFMLESCA